jgi:hypothetical protein
MVGYFGRKIVSEKHKKKWREICIYGNFLLILYHNKKDGKRLAEVINRIVSNTTKNTQKV